MATTTPSTNLQTGGSSWEPTKKQVEMSTARNPLNFNQTNNMRVPGEKKSFQMGADQQQQALKNEADKARRQSTPGAPMPGQAPADVTQIAQQVGQNLGSLGYRLQAKVKQFMSGGPQTVGLQAGNAEPTYNAATGQWENNTNVTTSLDPTVQQKVGEQKELAQAANLFLTDAGTGQKRALTFEEYLKTQSTNNQTTDYMLDLLDQLHEYEDMGVSDSAEARGIWDTLKSLDKDGMVTSLYKAERDYNRYFGLSDTDGVEKFSGTDPNEAKSLIDMVNLSTADIRKEVENSVLSASGLFSGNFESNIKDMLDKTSAKVKESNSLSTRARNDFSLALKKYIQSDTEGAGAISIERQKYKDAFSKVSEDIMTELSKADGGLAQAWFEATGGGGDIRETLFAALNDPKSGMSTSQRDQIQQLIGDLDQTAGGPKGKLNVWLDDLQSKGYFLTDKGKKVQPTNDQMIQITSVLRDQNITPEEKDAKMKEVIGNIKLDDETSVSKYFTDAISAVSMGTKNTEQALVAMKEGMVRSLKDFFKSRTFDLARRTMKENLNKAININDATNELAEGHKGFLTDAKIDDAEWGQMSEAEKMKVTKELLQHNPAMFKEAMAALKIKAQTEDDALSAQKTQLQTNLNEKLSNIENAVDVTKDANGNPVGLAGTGRIYTKLNDLKQRKAMVPGALWEQFKNKLTGVKNKFSIYKNTLAASPYIKSVLYNEPDPMKKNEILETLAKANAYQDFFRQSGAVTGGSFLISGNGGTIWDLGTAQMYLKGVEDTIPILDKVDPAKGKDQGDILANSIFNKVALSVASQNTDLGKSVAEHIKGLDAAIRQIEGDSTAVKSTDETEEDFQARKDGILGRATKDFAAYLKAKGTVDSIGNTIGNGMFSPEELLNSVILPAAKQIEDSGKAVPLASLDPRLKPFVSYVENGMAYLDFGDHTGSPTIDGLTAITEQTGHKDFVEPVDVAGMKMSGEWADKNFAPTSEPAPVAQQNTYTVGKEVMPVMTGNEAKYQDPKEIQDKASADKVAKGGEDLSAQGTNLPWLPQYGDDAASPENPNHNMYTAAKKIAAAKFLEDLAKGVDYKTALSNSWAAFFTAQDKGYKESGATGTPAVPKENKEIVDKPYEYEPEDTGEDTVEGEDIYKSGNNRML